MKFKTPGMQLYFKSDRIHPDLRRAAIDFEHWSGANGLPEPLVSDLQRSQAELVEMYFQRFRDLRALDEMGTIVHLDTENRNLALSLRGDTDEELKRKAEGRFSWHCVGCAVDFSSRPYNMDQLERIGSYFEERFGKEADPKNLWEFLLHSVVGRAPHFHLGRRDPDYRKKFSKGEGNA